VTIYYPDISGFQAGISLKGALVVAVKATEGTGYLNPDYARARSDAATNGTFVFAYHFLHQGSAAAQAAWCHSNVGKTPLMLDVEVTGTSTPTVADVTAFVDAYRRLGGIVYLTYLPHWYWQGNLGAPSLAPLSAQGLLLVSSSYTGYTDADSGIGWQPYGGMTPIVWQYTDSLVFNGTPVDFNAFRGSKYAGKQDPASVAAALAEFRSLVSTGSLPAQTPTVIGEEDSMLLLNGKNAVTPLVVPSGAKHLLFVADEGFQGLPPAEIRIGFGPTWSRTDISVNWLSSPVSVPVPDGASRVTVSRIDEGTVNVAAAFSA
jgi:Glycosyl hydrolases family 25